MEGWCRDVNKKLQNANAILQAGSSRSSIVLSRQKNERDGRRRRFGIIDHRRAQRRANERLSRRNRNYSALKPNIFSFLQCRDKTAHILLARIHSPVLLICIEAPKYERYPNYSRQSPKPRVKRSSVDGCYAISDKKAIMEQSTTLAREASAKRLWYLAQGSSRK